MACKTRGTHANLLSPATPASSSCPPIARLSSPHSIEAAAEAHECYVPCPHTQLTRGHWDLSLDLTPAFPTHLAYIKHLAGELAPSPASTKASPLPTQWFHSSPSWPAEGKQVQMLWGVAQHPGPHPHDVAFLELPSNFSQHWAQTQLRLGWHLSDRSCVQPPPDSKGIEVMGPQLMPQRLGRSYRTCQQEATSDCGCWRTQPGRGAHLVGLTLHTPLQGHVGMLCTHRFFPPGNPGDLCVCSTEPCAGNPIPHCLHEGPTLTVYTPIHDPTPRPGEERAQPCSRMLSLPPTRMPLSLLETSESGFSPHSLSLPFSQQVRTPPPRPPALAQSLGAVVGRTASCPGRPNTTVTATSAGHLQNSGQAGVPNLTSTDAKTNA